MLEAFLGSGRISWCGSYVLNHTGEIGICVRDTIKITFRKLNSF